MKESCKNCNDSVCLLLQGYLLELTELANKMADRILVLERKVTEFYTGDWK